MGDLPECDSRSVSDSAGTKKQEGDGHGGARRQLAHDGLAIQLQSTLLYLGHMLKRLSLAGKALLIPSMQIFYLLLFPLLPFAFPAAFATIIFKGVSVTVKDLAAIEKGRHILYTVELIFSTSIKGGPEACRSVNTTRIV